jgi:hypothetical protein
MLGILSYNMRMYQYKIGTDIKFFNNKVYYFL